ncbi:MAG: germination protein YpeB, partial [Clostridiales bacterium]|nr:germination protein YpeB [Clostridiales bacterium]
MHYAANESGFGLKSKIAVTIFFVLLLSACAFSVYQYQEKLKYRNAVVSLYDKAFYDTAEGVDKIATLLEKASTVERAEQIAPLYADIWQISARTKENLSSLPYAYEAVGKTSKYISQLSDFAYSVMEKTMLGSPLDSNDKKNSEQVREQAKTLANELLSAVSAAQVSGGENWDIFLDKDGNSDGSALAGFVGAAAESLKNAPELVYDGPFSDAVQNVSPKFIEDKPEISASVAEEVVKKVLSYAGIAFSEVKITGETGENQGTIPVYSFQADLSGGGYVYMDITKRGGLPLWALCSGYAPSGGNVDFEKARQNAEYFLDAIGYSSMKYSYYEYNNDELTINYCPYENGTIIYPDIIKVKVNCVNGAITAFDA